MRRTGNKKIVNYIVEEIEKDKIDLTKDEDFETDLIKCTVRERYALF